MKSKTLALIIFLLSVTTFVQGQTSHLTFKGVPINGTLEQFVAKMKEGGFKHMVTENGTAILNGDFAGYKDCKIGASVLKQKDLVYKIAVIFPEKEKWSTLSGNYFDLKDMLSEKYGKPKTTEEKFNTKYLTESNDDQLKMMGVKSDGCTYYSIFEIENGTIELSIIHNDYKCFVRLVYSDKINSGIIKAKAIDDL